MYRDLCLTITQSWDADPDARLSAGLVQIRVDQMIKTLLPRPNRRDKSRSFVTSQRINFNDQSRTTPLYETSGVNEFNQMNNTHFSHSRGNTDTDSTSMNIGSNYMNHMAPEGSTIFKF